MSTQTLKPNPPETPVMINRKKEAFWADSFYHPWSGVLGKECHFYTSVKGWHSEPSKNVTDGGKFKFKRRLDFKATGSYSIKAKFYRESFRLLSSPPPSRASQGLLQPEELTVSDCFPNWGNGEKQNEALDFVSLSKEEPRQLSPRRSWKIAYKNEVTVARDAGAPPGHTCPHMSTHVRHSATFLWKSPLSWSSLPLINNTNNRLES